MWYYGGRIRIEPDWNVKVFIDRPLTRDEKIRIEPDWNVKCKCRIYKGLSTGIRIEPDWNVKCSCTSTLNGFPPLE